MTMWSHAAGALTVVGLLACAVEKKAPVPETGKAVVEAYIRAWNAHDSAAIDSLLAPDGIHEDIAQNFRSKGAAQVVKFMRQHVASQPDFRWQLTNTIENGRQVAAEWTWTSTYTGPDMTGKQVSNRPLSGRGESFAEVEKGRIKRFTDYFDMASFFR